MTPLGRWSGRGRVWARIGTTTLAAWIAVALTACGSVEPSAALVTGSASAQASASQRSGAFTGPPVRPPRSSAAPAQVKIARSSIRLASGRSRAVALLVGSDILLCGGLTRAGSTTGSILRIDLRSGRVSAAGALPDPVHDAGGATLGNIGIIVGGGRLGPGSTVQRVRATGGARTSGALPAARADLAAVVVGGKLLVVGGGTPSRADVHVLATTDGRTFRVVATLRVGVRYPAVAALGGLVYVIGGSTPSGDSRAIQLIDPRTGAVRIIGHLRLGLSHASAFVLNGTVLVAGGRTAGRAQDGVWRLDPTNGTVATAGRLPYAVSDAAAVVVGGVSYMIGGEDTRSLASVITISVP